MKIKSIILAAGEGKRMKSQMPKVLHKICGQTMLNYVIDAANSLNVEECIVVIGHKGEEVKKTLPSKVKSVVQEAQLGTGHAVMMAYEHIDQEGVVIVLCGDGPLITKNTLRELMNFHKNGQYSATVLTTDLDNPTGYGRIVRAGSQLKKIVEEKDSSFEEKAIKEINSGIYCFDSKDLKKALPLIKNTNAQKEYYLTDILEIIKEFGEKIGVYKTKEYNDIMAVNSRVQLSEVEMVMRKRINLMHMENGVTIIDPANTYIEKEVKIGQDTIIHPGVILRGSTVIGKECIIEHNSKITDSEVANQVTIENSTIIESTIDTHSSIGPYAYLRPNSRIGKNVKIGDFVEIKNSIIGDYSKASHLSYIGDAEIGKNVNIGCGVVLVNYDGKEKHKSIIEDNAFIGSNSNLIAPIVIRRNAYVACGSTITREVPEETLAVARSRQMNKEGWVKRKGLQIKEDK
ncbi:MAG: bifunctional UDP-N-acetylglucosamine diphosphorylase/glucosamine-1-phosphate N-acetyltransferase GlmU [Clostridiales bacterium]|nr:bifunctional UDP-N-acetylglucosamine diphosphorylase/glucosamine-1-phosphate N-acetyltransferase GlmU [Clostridiales bacterium]